MHRILLAAVLLLACASPSFAAGKLPPGISGAWYNPAQSGHGISVEILDDDSAVVFWYAYDRTGKPLNLYVEARIEDASLSGVALAPRGMRFGAFDSATLVKPAWGDIRIDFTDCNTATLHYDAIDPAYGAGEIPLRRLTTLAERECPASFPDVLETGLYNASISNAQGYEVRAAIDGDGVLHMVQHGRASNGVVTLVQENFNYPQYLATGIPKPSSTTGLWTFDLDVRISNYFNTPLSSANHPEVLDVDSTGTGTVVPAPGTIPVSLLGPSNRRLDNALTLDAIAGNYSFVVTGLVSSMAFWQVRADGVVCAGDPTTPGSCSVFGKITPSSNGFFRFTFAYAPRPFEGIGWVEFDPVSGYREIVFSGDDFSAGGDRTIGIVAGSIEAAP